MHIYLTQEISDSISDALNLSRIKQDSTLIEIENEPIPAWNKGIPHSEESRKKMSLSRTGVKRSESFCKKISEYNTGRKWSDSRRKNHTSTKGRSFGPRDEETKKNISNSLLGRPKTEETKQKMRKPKSPEAIANMTIARRKRLTEKSL